MDRTFLSHIQRSEIQSKNLYLIYQTGDKIDKKTIMFLNERVADVVQRLQDLLFFQFSSVTRSLDIIVQFLFKLTKRCIYLFKREPFFQFPYFQVITFNDAAPQSIS